MTQKVEEIINLLDMLPEKEQDFACELLKKLVVAWDPDYTKLTPKEAKELEEAEKRSGTERTYKLEDIDWDNLDAMDL